MLATWVPDGETEDRPNPEAVALSPMPPTPPSSAKWVPFDIASHYCLSPPTGMSPARQKVAIVIDRVRAEAERDFFFSLVGFLRFCCRAFLRGKMLARRLVQADLSAALRSSEFLCLLAS